MLERAAEFLVVSALLLACKNAHKVVDGAPARDDAVPDGALADALPDAPPLIPCTPMNGTNVKVRKIGTIAGRAVIATSPPNDGRLFVVEQNGTIRIFENEVLNPVPFLDISADAGGRVLVAGNEMGLLGLAFHPQYASNRKFYVYYTAANPVSPAPMNNIYLDTLVEYTASTTNIDLADPTTARVLLEVPDFASNHNGGMLEFGSDGMLYLGIGDGGSGGDPRRNGQNTKALLAKILRIDVDHPSNGRPYGIPIDNPFSDGVAGAPEVWIYGVRNPWRWSFDRMTGDLWVGDVGQTQIEELDVLPAGSQAGRNLGWSAYEGATCCQNASDKCAQTGTQQPCDPTNKQMPQLELKHSDGYAAVIGGQVYRGKCFPDLAGTYFYTDYNKHNLSEAHLNQAGGLDVVDLPPPPGAGWPIKPTSIHADARGELFLTTLDGFVYAIEAGP